MIESTFSFLEGIGNKLSSKISSQVQNWDGFINSRKIDGISKKRKAYYDRRLKEAKRELYSLNSSYFAGLLEPSETWRLYDFFREDAVFLDIETTGLSQNDDLLMIGLFDGLNTKIMLKNNFNLNALKKELLKYKLIVTFNGSSFDIPFLNKKYPGLVPKIPNFDVKHAAAKAGLKGGLKEIEKSLGISRNPIMEKFYSGDVLKLWRTYMASGDGHYLKLLVEYNEDDVINLKKVAELVVEKLSGIQKSALFEEKG